ncbi:MAG TPA: 50S ribosomal protein L25 [Patescibacteria group bacterium]|nr:50S ribosomal protein L25 [Patescibacteria group bacterium]
MDKQILKAEERKITGRKVKTLRKLGLIPANVYGKDIKSVSLQVNQKEFKDVYKEVGETGLIMLELGKEEKPVLVHNRQLNPKTEEVIHVDFLQVNLKVKITANVPVEVIGEPIAEKQGVGTVVQYLKEVEVEALPTDLPEKFEVDTTELAEVDQAIYVKDLKFDKSKIEVKTNEDEIVVKVEPPQKEEEVIAPIVAVGAEGEVVAEGETPAEGQPAEGEAVPTPKEEGQK